MGTSMRWQPGSQGRWAEDQKSQNGRRRGVQMGRPKGQAGGRRPGALKQESRAARGGNLPCTSQRQPLSRGTGDSREQSPGSGHLDAAAPSGAAREPGLPLGGPLRQGDCHSAQCLSAGRTHSLPRSPVPCSVLALWRAPPAPTHRESQTRPGSDLGSRLSPHRTGHPGLDPAHRLSVGFTPGNAETCTFWVLR